MASCGNRREYLAVEGKRLGKGGRGGIRTHGELAPTPVFKTGALNRSATRPFLGPRTYHACRNPASAALTAPGGGRLLVTMTATRELEPVTDASHLYEVERRAYHLQRPGFRVAELQLSPTQKVPWHYHSNISDVLRARRRDAALPAEAEAGGAAEAWRELCRRGWPAASGDQRRQHVADLPDHAGVGDTTMCRWSDGQAACARRPGESCPRYRA